MENDDKDLARYDPIIKFFRSSFFLSLTVGVPFSIYKFLFGIILIRVSASLSQPVLEFLGFVVIVWSGVDLIMNLIRAGLNLAGRADTTEFCSLAHIGKFLNFTEVFLAFDTFLTFGIISSVLWFGWLRHLNPRESWFWIFATCLNLISLGVVSFWIEVIRHRRAGIDDKE